ncbi:MAG: Ldh family oxidoreductase, partial [Pseudomonadota bacterium]
TMHRFSVDTLTDVTRRIAAAMGTPPPIAAAVAEMLVGANLAGHDSHGVLRIPADLQSIEAGEIVPAAEPVILRETPGTLTIDGRSGFGHYTARWVMARLLEKARHADICCANLINHTHIGRLGEYAEQAARAGAIGIVMYGRTGVGRGGTAPYGGAASALSTNPIAAGVPTGDDVPFILDYATSKIAQGKVQVARSKGHDLPPGALIDKHGHPSVNPADYFEGGVLLPFGEHKGYALSLLIALLTGLSGHFDMQRATVSGVFMQAITISAFAPLEAYQRGVRAVLNAVKSTPPAPGFSEVLAPGEPEYRARVDRLAHGIELPATTYREIEQCALKLGVSLTADA